MDYNIDWLISDYGKFLEKFGLDESSVRQHYPEWQSRAGGGSAKDYLWYLFQVILGETAKQVKDPVDLEKNNLELYSAMWFFRTHVEGQKADALQQLINDTKVRLWQLELPFYFKVKMVSGNCCPYCNSLNGQLFEASDILNHEAFLVGDCTNDKGCNCTIAPVAERDDAGKIVLKEENKS